MSREVGEKLLGVVGRGKEGFFKGPTDFAGIDIESRDHFAVFDAPPANGFMHHADRIRLLGIVVNALHERTGTISHAGNRNSYFGHTIITPSASQKQP